MNNLLSCLNRSNGKPLNWSIMTISHISIGSISTNLKIEQRANGNKVDACKGPLHFIVSALQETRIMFLSRLCAPLIMTLKSGFKILSCCAHYFTVTKIYRFAYLVIRFYFWNRISALLQKMVNSVN